MSDQSAPPEQRQILHIFGKGPDYRTYHSSGVWGGPTPTGEITLNFYTEQLHIPEVICSNASESGLEEVYRSPGGDGQVLVERQIQCTIMMSPMQAAQLQEWLRQQIEQLIKVGAFQPVQPGEQP